MNEQIKELKPPEHEKPVAGVRCKIIKNCKSCQHSVGRISCALANRNFDSLERYAVPPDWCPLPFYTPPQAREPLTPAEINQIEARWDACMHGSKIAFVVRETEAAHGITGEKK